jgi:type II secretory pathway pseudopilin PulG
MSSIVRRVKSQAGVTLIELLVALGLSTVVLGTLAVLVITGARGARTTNDFLQTQAQVRAGLDQLTDEIRWAQSVVAGSATAVTLFIPQSTPYSASSPYTVTFAYDAGSRTITRQEDPDADGPILPGPAVPVAYLVVAADGSAGLSYEYFDATSTLLNPVDPPAVARVRIMVSTTSNGITRTLAGDSALRGE